MSTRAEAPRESEGRPPPFPWWPAGAAARVAVALMAIVPLVVLVRVAAIGAYIRPISDDYCQVAWVKADGFWGLVQHYWGLNGRAGNALVATVVHRLPGDIRVLPGIAAVAAVAASSLLVARLLRVNGWTTPRLAVAAAGIAISCALVMREGVNFYQTFLWTPGNITHTLPWVLVAALAAMAVGTRSRVARALVWPALVLGGLLLGTMTEVLSALTCALLALLVLGRVWHRRRLGRHDALALFGAAWVGVGLAVLLTSPGLANREGAASPVDPTIVGEALRIWPDVLVHAVARPWIVVPVAAGLVLGVLARPVAGDRLEGAAVPYRALLGWSGAALVVSLLGGSLLTVDADTTGFGARGAMNYPRTWLDFMAATAFCLVLLGVLVGRALADRVAVEREGAAPVAARGRPRAGVLALAAVVAPLAVAAVGVDQYVRVSEMAGTAQARASAWDAQARSIRAQAAAGAREVVYHPFAIGELSEPFSDTGRATFAKGCAETYFGVPRLLPPPQPRK